MWHKLVEFVNKVAAAYVILTGFWFLLGGPMTEFFTPAPVAMIWIAGKLLFEPRGRTAKLPGMDGGADPATALLASQMALDDKLREQVAKDLGNRVKSADALRAWFTAMIRTKTMAGLRDDIAREALARADWKRVAMAADGNVDWESVHRHA